MRSLRAEDVRRTQDDRLRVRMLPEERLREHVELDQIAHFAERAGGEERSVFRQELRIVRTRAVHVCTRKEHDLRNIVLAGGVEELLEAEQIPGVMIFPAVARIVHHAEMDQRRHLAVAEDLFHLLPA